MEPLEALLPVDPDVSGDHMAIARFGNDGRIVLFAVQVAHEPAYRGEVRGDARLGGQTLGDRLDPDIDGNVLPKECWIDTQVNVGGNVI
ncbi:hypothetical protein GCM10011515_11620 [Tsuneonella deserti]|uniref:Uncharacterized protein n=1 Tax=Tsuneonella deserti TaxID=2035528 RepID=A0ABQ1S7E5_9SPHN|nr:hypothetical protein GCM10011515_11620 [Tsuneonella deserti]